MLSNIAINEPRTFEVYLFFFKFFIKIIIIKNRCFLFQTKIFKLKSLCTIAKQHIINTNLYNLKLEHPEGVYNRSLFVDETNQ